MPRRRRVLAAAGLGVASALAGCTRRLRSNDVPGGLILRNDRTEPVRIRVRTSMAPESAETGPTATAGDEDSETGAAVVADSTYPLDPGSEGTVRDFFPGPGRYRVEASVGAATASDTLQLHRTLGGGIGADTVFVTVTTGGISVVATDLD